jgi:hypothetical protein
MGRVRATVTRSATRLFQKLDRRRWRIDVTVEHADEVPERIPRRRAVLVGTPGVRKWLVFDCPCTEHHRVMLNLDRGRRPSWALGPDEILTISPSVDAPSARGRCHYFIRSGRVQWVKRRRFRT